MRNTALIIVGLLVLLVVLVNLTPVQNFITRKATDYLSKKLHTTVSIKHLRVDFLNHVVIEGLYIEGQVKDTLLYAGEARVRISDWFIFRNEKPVLRYIGLHNAYAHLYRTQQSKVWNYEFITDAFETKGKKPTSTKKKEFEIDLKKLDLQNVRFNMDDAWVGSDMDFNLGNFQLDADAIDFKKKNIDINSVDVSAIIDMREYESSPLRKRRHKRVKVVDTTAFNPALWTIHVDKLNLKDSRFNLTLDSGKVVPGEFDEDHIYVKNIGIAASNINIVGDTIRGNLDNLTAEERCGIIIKKMRSKVTVSPNASICENLYLETNRSKLYDYYAMHYARFPAFEDYIEQVVMVARMKNAIVDTRDIAYFAPELHNIPALLHVSGSARGTVADIAAKDLKVTDGTTVVNGDLRMTGLPDIYKTFIRFENGSIATTGAGILHYAPAQKDNPNLALERILYAYFKGNYTGYIENFAVDGTLNTNLGTIQSKVKMTVPDFNTEHANYSGTIATTSFDIGTLLRQPDLGIIAIKATISGKTFDLNNGEIKINNIIDRFDFKGYSYRNILADGVLGKKQFKGTMQINDSNLAMAFYGGIDFSQKQVSVNATANILRSNFLALGLTKDTVIGVADFDLNCTGSNIDNFSGYAKLYNIDMRRNQHRLDLDSIYINSTIDASQRTLTIQSNDIVASIKGDYQLSQLPYAIQYYISGYIPNYIKPPKKAIANQNLTFNIKTTQVDNLLSVIFPNVRGFDNSVFEGSLNTAQQKLSLNASVPYAAISKFSMHNIHVESKGNLDQIELNAQIDDVAMGDSILRSSLDVKTTLGNDSLKFHIATATSDGNSSANLNGELFARNDSLFLTVMPSKFFLNQLRWDIAGGSRIVYSKKYLSVQDLVLSSGLQKITASTQYNGNIQSLSITTENLDLGQLGTWAGLAAYQPDGRLNGTIRIDNMFTKPYVLANLKATNLVLGADTIGNVSIAGAYDDNRKLLIVDPQSGIYRGNASLAASGTIAFDSLNHQKMEGTIQLNDAPVAWSSAFLTGVASQLGGTLNGSINISGTPSNPHIGGSILLNNGALHIDFLGSNYTIPSATIALDDSKIAVNNLLMYDVYKNTATVNGYISHKRFADWRLRMSIKSRKIQCFDLNSHENELFYGELIAGMDSMTIRGPFTDITMNIVNAYPSAKSNIYIPVVYGNDVGAYSYVSFKTYGKDQEPLKKKNKDKLTLSIDANLNELAEITLVLDPVTGDAIAARGNGHLQMQVPPNNDARLYGTYNITEGSYTLTFRQLLSLHRRFVLNDGSTILFNGPFEQTTMDVDATYTVHTRLYDLLSETDKNLMSNSELSDSKVAQDVNVLLHMKGTLDNPQLTFNVETADKHSVGTYAYTKLERLNTDARQLFDQVASLLIIGDFIPPEGMGSSTAVTGAINNVSQILSTTASSQLTNMVNKILGDKNLAIDVKYSNYNLSDPTGLNSRNQFALGVRKNYFDDRLVVEVGGKSDWGRPTSNANTNNFNITGDFRIQYILTENGNIRLNGFRTSDYDVTLDRSITRSGVGISWRKTFDNLSGFFRPSRPRYLDPEKPVVLPPTFDSIKSTKAEEKQGASN